MSESRWSTPALRLATYDGMCAPRMSAGNRCFGELTFSSRKPFTCAAVEPSRASERARSGSAAQAGLVAMRSSSGTSAIVPSMSTIVPRSSVRPFAFTSTEKRCHGGELHVEQQRQGKRRGYTEADRVVHQCGVVRVLEHVEGEESDQPIELDLRDAHDDRAHLRVVDRRQRERERHVEVPRRLVLAAA